MFSVWDTKVVCKNRTRVRVVLETKRFTFVSGTLACLAPKIVTTVGTEIMSVLKLGGHTGKPPTQASSATAAGTDPISTGACAHQWAVQHRLGYRVEENWFLRFSRPAAAESARVR
ncbi:hypothetical protein MRX96_041560 [Rhipicephalus microplus]